MKSLDTRFRIIGKQDFRNDRSQLIWSYIYRIIALLIFSGAFYEYVNFIHGKTSFHSLVNIKINDIPEFVSVFLLIVNVIFVLFLHELIHAGAYYFTKRQSPEIGIRGLVIYAAAPNLVISRKEILINAIAPFVIISLVGLVAMTFFSPTIISWVFIPTLINAAASGGDFMTVCFILKQGKTTYFNDVGDIIYALHPKQ